MDAWEQRPRRTKTTSRRRDFGRTLARLLCFVFALLGMVPLSGGLLIRSQPVKDWAARETSRVLAQELGLEATFSVDMSFIPLRIAITDLSVPATDGGSPAVEAGVASVSPRFFSLLAGRIDVGDIELEDTEIRLVVQDGAVKNLTYRLPETKSDKKLTQAPFRSLAVTGANLDLTIDGTHLRTEGIDIDAFAEPGLTFDVALRTGETHILAKRQVAEEGSVRVLYDEDRVCAIEARVLASPEEVMIRRFSLLGTVDLDEEEDTLPECNDPGPAQLAVRLSQAKIALAPTPGGSPDKASPASPKSTNDNSEVEGLGLLDMRGHVMLRAPLALVERLSPSLVATGWVGFSGDIRTGGNTRMPEVVGKVTGQGLQLNDFAIAEEIKIELLLAADVVNVPSMYARWGNGEAWLEDVQVKPFEEKIPLTVRKATTKEIDFPGVMRDVGVTAHSWVDWNFGNTVLTKIAGTITPFYIDGGVTAETHGFTVWDRGFDDPARKRMVGIEQANVVGRWRAHPTALEFYNCDVTFGESRLPVDLVSVGLYDAPLVVRLKPEGGTIDLANVSPIADIDLQGKADVFVNLEGPKDHPVLKGTLGVEGLVIEDFEAGNIEESNVHFEPLFVEWTDLKGHKGVMSYELPVARLSFDGPATVDFTAAARSAQFDLVEFFDVFHFDEDPRFEGLRGTGSVEAQVRYLMGGPEDTCPDGRLIVNGSATMTEAEAFGEKFSGGEGQFAFEWFDIDAGTRGMRVNVPSLTLQKGTGTVFAAVQMRPGGVLAGDVVGTQIPVARIDSFGEILNHADGFVSGSARLGGTADALSFDAHVNVSPLEAGKVELPPSQLQIRLVPQKNEPFPGSVLGTSKCGRTIYAPYSQAEYDADRSDGKFIINGQLLGGQVALKDVSITRQRDKVLAGGVGLRDVNLTKLGAFFGVEALAGLATGELSGGLDLENLPLVDPYAARGKLTLREMNVTSGTTKVELHDESAHLTIFDRKVQSEGLAFVATTQTGQKGVLDAKLLIDDQSRLDMTVDLRPTNLAVVASAVEGIEQADGELRASVALRGPLKSPAITGFVEVENGKLAFAELPSVVSDLYLTVALDEAGLHVARGTAKWGGGDVVVKGDAPIVGDKLGRTDLTISARGVSLPIDEDVRAAFDANLALSIPAPSSTVNELPQLTGNVTLLSGSYEKQMRMTADIATLAARGEKTEVEGYDPEDDLLDIDVLLTSSRPLRVENELVVATLRIDPAGLRLTGTDQKFGAVGTVEVEQGGQVFLRRNEFEVQRGLVRFNDPTRLRPEVDMTAVTEYRRYEDRGDGDSAQPTANPTSSAPVAGNWRIMMHAYGPPDDLKVDLNSDPPLAQDDIFLLLTVGLTRTEFDQTQNSGVGSAVALEALGSLSGAESAVTETVPVDEFRFGSNYSSRSGRTEPTLTIGKRLSRRIRASVTTTLADSSEVRSHIEYRATESLSLEGSYDNAGDVASATGGNLGGDVRWRLEFQ